MPERPVAPERPLLAGKLATPTLRDGTVPRKRLLRHLDETLRMRLGLVVAPAGWGKTTLLSQWVTQTARDCNVAWLTLDETDDDPRRFWTYVVTALLRQAPHIGGDALAALRVPVVDPLDVAVPTLLNDLAASDDCHVLILDDYHALADSRISEGLEFLLTYLPPSLHVVIAARFDPPLPLARMRARGELTEIRAAELRFASSEAAGLVSTVGAVALDAEPLDGLVDRTEGWAAGLKLAALTLRGTNDPQTRAQAIRGDERHIIDYLTSEVLDQVPAEQRDFLLQTSPLDRLYGPLCDAALERENSQATLQALERADLFIVALDRQRDWYRYHRLFREALRRELDATAPQLVAGVLRRAADWYGQHGHLEDAIRARIAAGDVAVATELLLGAEDVLLDQGAAGTYVRLGDALGEQALRADPRLGVSMAAAAGLSGQLDRVPALLDAAEPYISDEGTPYANWRSLAAAAAVLRATYGHARPSDAATALASAQRAVELETDPSLHGWAISRIALGSTLVGHGRHNEAVAALSQARDRSVPLRLPMFTQLLTAGLLALCLLDGERDDDATTLFQEVAPAAEALEHALGDASAPAVTLLRVAEGRLAYLRGDVIGARDLLVRAAELARVTGHPSQMLRALITLADAQLAAGDRAAARTALDEAQEIADSWSVQPGTTQRLIDAQARVGRRAARAALREHRMAEALTDRELSILRKLQGPLTQREIASELFLSVNTVKGYTKSLYRKLGVAARSEAIERGRELGFI